MRKLISILWLLIFISPMIFSQNVSMQPISFEKAKLKSGSAEEFFSKNTGFPENLIFNNVNINVIISFIITKDGKIDSVKIIKSSNQNATVEALSALSKSDNLWEPTKINGQSVAWEYYASFKFVTSSKYFDQKNKVQKLIQKDKFDNSLTLLDELVKFHEYDKESYQLRSSIYKKLNKTDQENSDIKKIEFIDKNLIVDIWLTAIGIPRK